MHTQDRIFDARLQSFVFHYCTIPTKNQPSKWMHRSLCTSFPSQLLRAWALIPLFGSIQFFSLVPHSHVQTTTILQHLSLRVTFNMNALNKNMVESILAETYQEAVSSAMGPVCNRNRAQELDQLLANSNVENRANLAIISPSRPKCTLT